MTTSSHNHNNRYIITLHCKPCCVLLLPVYKVKVLSVNQSYYDRYVMEITQVIKLGKQP